MNLNLRKVTIITMPIVSLGVTPQNRVAETVGLISTAVLRYM